MPANAAQRKRSSKATNAAAVAAQAPPAMVLVLFPPTRHGYVNGVVRSFTGKGDYRVFVNPKNGRVHCECPDFEFRHKPHLPTLADADHHCKHLAFFAGELAMATYPQPIETEKTSCQQP